MFDQSRGLLTDPIIEFGKPLGETDPSIVWRAEAAGRTGAHASDEATAAFVR